MYQVHYENSVSEIYLSCEFTDFYSALMYGIGLFTSMDDLRCVRVSHYEDDGFLATDALFMLGC